MICIVISFLFTKFAKKLKLSAVIGLIIAGIVMGSPLLTLFIEPNTGVILDLGSLGLVFLMFLAGMEVSFDMLKKEEKDSLIVGSLATIVPFLMGFVAFLFLGFSCLTSFTVGICMSITAEATTSLVLLELNKLKTRIGSLMLESGIIDDILGISLFVFVVYLFTGNFTTREVITLVLSVAGFGIGIIVNKFLGREHEKINYLENFLMIFVIPFFFISLGVYFSLKSLTLNPLLLIIIVVIAMTGKIAGVMLAGPLIKLPLNKLYLVGWGMNSRGAVGLAVAFIALKIGLLDSTLYSGLVFMTLITTLIFPFIIRRMVEKYPDIME
ncbi:hypothetical protein BEH94_01235 [Candidatus Altiarchaeales archaeon WOR_SM1_SCG]|nr:hypothetical protein BEH94_01235 [Candidatus Altiarchaeales archaeon WOR_SM1_SCG]